ncbi:MFS transporter [Aspergillus stella-maris]|uniref:MFS transporter n=1 Tax=Aspergillus stella-maris TaxID=1810926 RepID=UPI003CCE3664
MSTTNTDPITPAPLTDIELKPITLNPSKENDPYLVAFAEPYDPENPKDWHTGRKWAVTDVMSATGFNRIMVSTIMAPALSTIAREFDMTSAESAMALSIYLLATAVGPLFIGPLSEVYGRRPVLHASNLWFLVWNMVCGFANSKELLIASRFLAGFGASAIYSLASGVLGDVWRPEQRGSSLAVYQLIPLLGSAVGPIIGGFMAGRTTWRWMFWSTSIFQAIMIIVSFSVFKETYGPLILSKRVERLRRETNESRYKTADERLYGHKSPWSVLGRALIRPLRLLTFHPIIQIVAIISAFYYGILYIVISTFSSLWTEKYHQSVELSGLHYIGIAIGEIIGSQVTARLMDKLYKHHTVTLGREHTPESRLPMEALGSLLAPLGLIIYGWVAEYKAHWAIVDLAMVLTMAGMQSNGMPMLAFVIEAYPEHVSSAIGARQCVMSLTAFCFPLFAPAMYNSLGYGWANTTIAGVGLLLGLPAPFALWYWGERLRGRARGSY